MHDANTPPGGSEQPLESGSTPLGAEKQDLTEQSVSPESTSSRPVQSGVHAAEQAVADAQVAADKASQAAAQAQAPEIPDLANLSGSRGGDAIDMLDDVELEVRIELGRTRMLVEDVLRLSSDAVVELDKAAGDPVDIYVNGRRIARGEVLVLNENFCIRVSEIVEPQTRTA